MLRKQCANTQIALGNALFSQELERVLAKAPRAIIVHDSYFDDLFTELPEHARAFSVPSGEESKSREMKEAIEDTMLDSGFDRSALVIAVGGGMVCDLAGFVAATYLRGIASVYFPTTLLAMVDAAIGGKTAVNTPHGKNLIGALHEPQEVLIDSAFIDSLPTEVYRQAAAEIIKYGCIMNEELFALLETNSELWHERSAPFIEELIRRAIEAKSSVIELDICEKGYRHILNYGHTIGHAIEAMSGYSIPHGDAVAIGLYIETRLSCDFAGAPAEAHRTVRRVLESYGFPLTLSAVYNPEAYLSALRRDKKATADGVRCVLLQHIGRACVFQGAYCTALSEEMIARSCHYIEELTL